MKLPSTSLSSREFLTPDLSLIDFQDAQQGDRERILSISDYYAKSRIARTYFFGNKVIGCVGIFEKWQGTCLGWAIFDQKIGGIGMLGVVRDIKKSMDDLLMMYHRVEITVISGFSAGHRLADLLGFTVEGLMYKYDHLQRDHYLYSRIRDV